MTSRGPLHDASSLHETVLENLSDGVYYVDRKRAIVYWNPAAERISGRDAAAVVGRSCFDNILGHVDDAGRQLCFDGCPLVRSMAQRRGVEADVFLRHLDGHRVPVHVRCQPIRDPDGKVVGAVEIFNDNGDYRDTLSRIAALERASSQDALTGLPNRGVAELALRSRLYDVKDGGWPLGLLFVDIDGFKQVNDEYGHAAGDDVLGVVGRSLAAGLRESDIAARWGGDEFVILSAASDREQIEVLARRLRSLVATSAITIGESQVSVTLSVGATLADPSDTIETLVCRADKAMYESKHAGRDRLTFAERS